MPKLTERRQHEIAEAQSKDKSFEKGVLGT